MGNLLDDARAILDQLGILAPSAPGLDDWLRLLREADQRIDATRAALPSAVAQIGAALNPLPAPPKPLRIRGRKRVRSA